MDIILYTIHCPKCKQLERMLDKANMRYEVCTDIDCMAALGIREAPYLQVGGTLMNFAQAWKWIKEQQQQQQNEAK